MSERELQGSGRQETTGARDLGRGGRKIWGRQGGRDLGEGEGEGGGARTGFWICDLGEEEKV